MVVPAVMSARTMGPPSNHRRRPQHVPHPNVTASNDITGTGIWNYYDEHIPIIQERNIIVMHTSLYGAHMSIKVVSIQTLPKGYSECREEKGTGDIPANINDTRAAVPVETCPEVEERRSPQDNTTKHIL